MRAYEDSVGERPGIDAMREIVCTQKLRPQIIPSWRNHVVSLPPSHSIPSLPPSLPLSLPLLPLSLLSLSLFSPSLSLPLSLPLSLSPFLSSLPSLSHSVSLSLQCLSYLLDTIEECWDEDPEARLSAINVVLRLKELLDGGPTALTSDYLTSHTFIVPGNERFRYSGAQESTADTIGTTDSRPPPYDNRWANAGGVDESFSGSMGFESTV